MQSVFPQSLLLALVLIAVWLVAPAVAETPTTLSGHTNVVSSVGFTPDGSQLVSGSWDETIGVWNVAAGNSADFLAGHTDWIEAVAITPDGEHIVSASQRSVRTWKLQSLSLESVFTAPAAFSISSMALSPDGRWLACGIRDGTVRIWEVGVDEPRWSFPTDEAWTKALTFSADAGLLAAGNWLGQLRVWNLEHGEQVFSQAAHPDAPIASLAFSPDGQQLAAGSFDATISIRDTAEWQLQRTLKGHKGLVLSLAFSPDSQLLASGERHGPIKVWSDVAEPVLEFEGHPDGKLGFSVVALAFSPDGKRLASASYDRTTKLWPVTTP